MNVRPLQNLARQNQELLPEYRKVFEEFVASGRYVSGPLVQRFEEEFANYCGVSHCIAVSTGTAALEVAIRATGLGAGHRIAIPAMTFVATAQAVVQSGATPVLIDVDPVTWNMDPRALESSLPSGIDAIVPVHLHGRLVAIDAIESIASANGISILEDSAQAVGAKSEKGKAGSFGLAGAFSFYPGKNLGTLGEGGAIVTHHEQLAESARLYRNWGARRRYEHDSPGTNYRMNELMAGFLSIKLPFVDEWIAHRQQAAKWYASALGDLPITIPAPAGDSHAYHIYSIWSEARDEIAEQLHRDGYEVGIHYPRPVHLNAMFADLGYERGDFPVAEKLASGFLSLPMDEFITLSEIDKIAESIGRVVSEH